MSSLAKCLVGNKLEISARRLAAVLG